MHYSYRKLLESIIEKIKNVLILLHKNTYRFCFNYNFKQTKLINDFLNMKCFYCNFLNYSIMKSTHVWLA